MDPATAPPRVLGRRAVPGRRPELRRRSLLLLLLLLTPLLLLLSLFLPLLLPVLFARVLVDPRGL